MSASEAQRVQPSVAAPSVAIFGKALHALAVAVALLAFASGHAYCADLSQPIRNLAAIFGSGDVPSAASARSAVERSFDMDAISRSVLANDAKNATAAQLRRFHAALTGRVVYELLHRLRPGRRWRLDVVQTRQISEYEALLTSKASATGEGTKTIAWRVRAAGKSAEIVDVLGNGSSMVRQLRDDYETSARRFGLDGTIQKMEARYQ